MGLKGELTTKWTEYRPGNAIELNHTWKLHNEPDLGVSLGMFAMDWNGCYKVPKRAKLLQDQQQQQKNKKDSSLNAVTDEDEEGCDPSSKRDKLDLHPDDAELLHWTGSMVCAFLECPIILLNSFVDLEILVHSIYILYSFFLIFSYLLFATKFREIPQRKNSRLVERGLVPWLYWALRVWM